MVKGTIKQMIVVKSPDPSLFEKAVFILRDDAQLARGVTRDDVLRQAERIAGDYVRKNIGRRKFGLLRGQR